MTRGPVVYRGQLGAVLDGSQDYAVRPLFTADITHCDIDALFTYWWNRVVRLSITVMMWCPVTFYGELRSLLTNNLVRYDSHLRPISRGAVEIYGQYHVEQLSFTVYIIWSSCHLRSISHGAVVIYSQYNALRLPFTTNVMLCGWLSDNSRFLRPAYPNRIQFHRIRLFSNYY